MNVNFDGLRKILITNYNSLTKKLNVNIKDTSWDSHILIDPNEIEMEMDGIRNVIVTLAFMYQDGEDGFKTLDEDTHFETFNPIEENE